ncbi:protein ALP1-like [Beta vulgaris subsp. vulgaris]|uniref:protein ALP1-like n=1 Tax=Beta vulgaris subsp. vulgaris TaxID=3555 RepID=UPI002548982A|nr:protein ALP1-like [Beta vulgaris subsp. vulgaris]
MERLLCRQCPLPPRLFRRRFRMQKHVFLRIVDVLINKNTFFQQRPDATGRLGASALLKCTAAIRLLAYATSADSVDDYLKISGSLARDSLQHFVEGVVAEFGDEYLRRPNETDLTRLLYAGEERGFPGMMGSIDCMHWRWKNCPLQFKGLYSGRAGKPTLVLEAIASYDLWIWHAFFGTPGRCNDINVLDRSPIFNDVFEGRAPPVNYVINGHQYDMGYYLTDGIYPQWAAFIPTISLPLNEKESLFAQKQESKRKDVERAFGVLQARFAIIRQPALARDKYMLGKIMFACIIIHNMITEDERDSYSLRFDPHDYDQDFRPSSSRRQNADEPFIYHNSDNRIGNLQTFMNNRDRVRDQAMHRRLKLDLVENIWLKFGLNNEQTS